MKTIFFGVREDELDSIKEFSKKYNLEIKTISENLTSSNIELAKGYEAISVLGKCELTNINIKLLKKYGVKLVASRSAGYDNFDIPTLKECNILATNVPKYSPTAISEHAVLLSMMLLRNSKLMLKNVEKENFGLKGLIGREVRSQVVGVIGTGNIGYNTIKNFKGLNAKKILAYDLYENEKVKEIAEYTDLKTLLRKSDIISIHIPLTSDNKYLINKETLKLVKPTSVIVNTSRGALINTKDALDAIKNNKLNGLALDVYEYEDGVFHVDRSKNKTGDRVLEELIKQDNVIISPHYAFYTNDAVSNMVEKACENIYSYYTTKKILTSIY